MTMAKAAALFLAALPAVCPAALFAPGTYIGEAPGRNGMIRVEAEVDESRILSIRVAGHRETGGLADAPLAAIPERIVSGQTLAVDAISGATFTSRGVLGAARNALSQAAPDLGFLDRKPAVRDAVIGDAETDVVVIGAGTSGMTAAIAAAEAGSRVMVIDKQGLIGAGDSMNISTSLGGGGSKIAVRLGHPEATAEAFYRKLMKEAETKKIPVNEAMIRTYALRSGEIADWLADLGVPFGRYDAKGFKHHTADGSAPGPHIMRALAGRAAELGIEVRLDTKALHLTTEDGRVTGVEAVHGESEYRVKAAAVVLATGGFAANHELVGEFTPEWLGRPTTGAPSSTGDGIRMAREAGADVRNMDQVKVNYLGHPVGGGLCVSLTALTPYTILINHEGKRFVTESHPSINHKSRAMLKQPRGEAYAVIDQSAMDRLKIARNYAEVGYFVRGDTPEELCSRLETVQENCVKTVKDYLRASETGEDREFMREIRWPMKKMPLWASLVTPSLQSTYGGIRTNTRAQAVTRDGAPIPGLYAAGATSGHESYANEVGNATIIGMVFGRIAGENAAALAVARRR